MPDPAPHAPWRSVGVPLLLLTALVSGVATFVNAYAVQGTSSDAFVTVRNLAVAAMLVPVALLAVGPRPAPLSRGDWLRLGVIGLVGGAVPFLLFFRGLALATAAGGAATASFGYRSLFLFATLFAVVALGERLRGRVAVGAALLLGGNALLLALTAPVLTDGTGYVLAATVLWAAEYTLSKRTLRDLPPTTVALGRMGFGGVFLTGFLVVSGEAGGVLALGPAQWGWVGISAVLLLAFVTTWYAGLARVDVGVATSVLVLGFPITWALATALRGAPLTLGAAAGAAAIVVGVAVAVGLEAWRAAGRALAGLGRREAGPAP